MADEIRCAIELRAVDDRSSPGRIVGTLLRYGDRADRGGFSETFEPGSLTWPTNGVVLRRQHDRSSPIMRVVPEERDGVVRIDAPLPDTQAGRDAAAEVREGLFSGLSVEFRAQSQRFSGRERRVKAALLTGAGLVDEPAYRESRVSVRHREAAGRRSVRTAAHW